MDDLVPEAAALRARADHLVAVELRRLRKRRPELGDERGDDIAQTMHRVVRRLLHHPNVLVRRTAGGPDGERYAALLRQLFDLKPPEPTAAPVAADPAAITDASHVVRQVAYARIHGLRTGP
jgi:glutamyl-tRNA reductase